MFFKAPPESIELNNELRNGAPTGHRPKRRYSTIAIGLASCVALTSGWAALVAMAAPNDLSTIEGAASEQATRIDSGELATPKPPTIQIGNDSKCDYLVQLVWRSGTHVRVPAVDRSFNALTLGSMDRRFQCLCLLVRPFWSEQMSFQV